MNRILVLLTVFFLTMVSHASPPPPAEAVFKLTTKTLDPNTLVLQWTIEPGYFLYRDKIQLKQLPNEKLHLGAARFPTSINKINGYGLKTPIYRGSLELPVPVLGDDAGERLLSIGFQGCSDTGFCYPPQTKTIQLIFNNQHELTTVNLEATQQPNSIRTTEAKKEVDDIHDLFSTHNWLFILASFFGFGVLLAFTPCVLPMIPVLSGIIVGQGKHLSTHKAFLLSLSYVLSMALTYSVIGATVALIGSNLQVLMQSPWAILMFSGIFILLAFSMFDFYDLKLPSSWQHALASFSHSKAGGYYLGAAIMGALSTLILSPCVTAPLVGALGYIANTGDVARGSFALFFLGLGMGTPLLIMGTTAGKWLPKSGAWMHAIKGFFGLLLLAVAIHLLERVVASVITMAAWASLLILSGLYLGALRHPLTNQAQFRQAIGIVFLIYGVLILVGASQGNRSPIYPLASPTPSHATIQTVTTRASVQRAMADAHQIGKSVILDFYADWCETCQSIEKNTLGNLAVQNALENVVLLKVDVTKNDQESHALLTYFDVIAPPTFLFFNPQGVEQKSKRHVGAVSPTQLLRDIELIN